MNKDRGRFKRTGQAGGESIFLYRNFSMGEILPLTNSSGLPSHRNEFVNRLLGILNLRESNKKLSLFGHSLSRDQAQWICSAYTHMACMKKDAAQLAGSIHLLETFRPQGSYEENLFRHKVDVVTFAEPEADEARQLAHFQETRRPAEIIDWIQVARVFRDREIPAAIQDAYGVFQGFYQNGFDSEAFQRIVNNLGVLRETVNQMNIRATNLLLPLPPS